MINNHKYVEKLISKISKKYFDDVEIFEPIFKLVDNFDGKNSQEAECVGLADTEEDFSIELYDPFILFHRIHNKKYNELLVAHELCHLWVSLKKGNEYHHHSKFFKEKMKTIEKDLKLETSNQRNILTDRFLTNMKV